MRKLCEAYAPGSASFVGSGVRRRLYLVGIVYMVTGRVQICGVPNGINFEPRHNLATGLGRTPASAPGRLRSLGAGRRGRVWRNGWSRDIPSGRQIRSPAS